MDEFSLLQESKRQKREELNKEKKKEKKNAKNIEEDQLQKFVKAFNDSTYTNEKITFHDVRTLYDLKISLRKLYSLKQYIIRSNLKFKSLFINPYLFSKRYPPALTYKQCEHLEIELNIQNISDNDKLESFVIYVISNNSFNNDSYCSDKTLKYNINREIKIINKKIIENNVYGKQRENLRLLQNKALLEKSINNVTVREYVTFEHYSRDGRKLKYNNIGTTLEYIRKQEQECQEIIRGYNSLDIDNEEEEEETPYEFDLNTDSEHEEEEDKLPYEFDLNTDSEHDEKENNEDEEITIDDIPADVLKVIGTQTLNEKQSEGLLNALNNPLSVITGGPGCGKTTLINSLNKYFNKIKLQTVNLAFCGKAVRTISHRLGKLEMSECYTLHKFLYNEIYKEDADYSDCVIIVDEVSMLDLNMLHTLLKYAEKEDARLIFVGDNDQLPPIGIGNPFEAIIQNIVKENIPYVKLDTQMRFDNIDIPNMLVDIKSKTFPMKNKYDKSLNIININKEHFDMFNFLKENKMYDKSTLMNRDSILFLTPEHDKDYGKNSLNKTLQSLINDNCNEDNIICKTYSNIFYNGDKVIRIHNNYTREISRYNGDEAIIEIHNENREKKIKEPKIKVMYWNKYKNEYGNSNGYLMFEEIITMRELKDEFDLGYARTIHKSQGGEATQVVLFGPLSEHSSWNRSNGVKLLRVAVSRAKNKVHMICNPEHIKDVLKKDTCLSTSKMFKY